MKKVYYILMLMAAIFMISCSEDDTPQLTGTVAPELYGYEGDTIKADGTGYTLNWSSVRFYTDNNTSSTSIGSYEMQGVNYNIQIDTVGGDFSSGANLGSVVGKYYYTFTYSDLETAATEQLGLTCENDSAIELQVRLQAVYASNADAGSVYSNSINLPVVLSATVVKTLPKIYVCDNYGFSDYYLYVWTNDGDVKDPWPGVHYSSIQTVDGVMYYVFELSKEYCDMPGMNIILNENGSKQLDLMQNYIISQDVYVTVGADGNFTYK